MSLTNNRLFLLASAQLFPLDILEPASLDTEDLALSLAKDAFSAYKKGALESALEQYSLAIKKFPDQPFFYACRSILNNHLGDEEGAFYDYQVAKGLDFNYQAFLEWLDNRPLETEEIAMGQDLEALLSAALEATQQFDYAYALELYARIQQAYPEQVDVIVYRAALHMRLLQYDKALTELNQAISINPQHFNAYFYRAKLFKALQENNKAIADFNRAVDIQPDTGMAYEERGDFFVHLKAYPEALLDYNRLVDLLPDDFYVYALRADLFEKMDNWEAALGDYSTAITLNPYYSDLYAYRADIRDRLGDRTGAQEDRRIFKELEEED